MVSLFNLLIVFILALVAIALLGLIAGFSPTLYIAQATLISKPKHANKYTLAIMTGVLAAVILFVVLFQFFNLTTLSKLIDSVETALLLSIVFNSIVGLLFIYGGLRYVRFSDAKSAYQADTQRVGKTSIGAIVSFGFVRTILSVSSVTAVFIGGNLIASASHSLVENSILTLIFLSASIAPFLVVLILARRYPDRVASAIDKTKYRLTKLNYRMTVGAAALIFGCAIIIFNSMMALFY